MNAGENGLSLGVDYEGPNQSQHGDRNWLEEWGNWFGFVCVIFIVSMEMFKLIRRTWANAQVREYSVCM